MTTRLRQSLYRAAEAGYYLFWRVLSFLVFGLPVISKFAIRHSFWAENGAVILVYHELGGRVFARHLEFIKQHWQIVSLDHLVTNLRHAKNLAWSVAITFDDGYKSNYTDVFPILKKYSAPITLYLVSGMVNTDKEFWWQSLARLQKKGVKVPTSDYFKSLPEEERRREMEDLLARHKYLPEEENTLTWSEVKDMAGSGLITIGSHTRNHPCLTKTSMENATIEITDSKKELEAVGIKVDHFSYPNGDYNASHIPLCQQSGYVSAVTAIPGINTLKTNPYELRRILIRPDDTPPVLAMKITGLGHRLGMDILTIKHLRQRGVPY